MALKSFVDDARKTNRLMEQLAEAKTGTADTIIDVSDGQGMPSEKLEEFRSKQTSGLPSASQESYRAIPSTKPRTDFEKQYMQRQKETTYTSSGSKQKVEEQHCNIIANVIKQSGSTTTGDTNWEGCKFKKDCDGTIYCTEFHSLCGKERCNRATK
jgi:hypothetical protein